MNEQIDQTIATIRYRLSETDIRLAAENSDHVGRVYALDIAGPLKMVAYDQMVA